MSSIIRSFWQKTLLFLPYVTIFTAGVCYLLLSLVKHYNYLSGYDLAVIDQAIWKYSQFMNPITTVHAYPTSPIYADHIELIYILFAPLYWVWSSSAVLLILQVIGICASALAIFLIAKHRKINYWVSLALIVSYLLFYGIQNAIWADAHSLVFAIPFLAWFIYSIELKKTKLSLLFLILAIICKEDIGLFTFLISFVYYLKTKRKELLVYMLISLIYIAAIFLVYFPYFSQDGYRFQNENGLLSQIDLRNMYNTSEKREVLVYSLASYGFIPLLMPLFLIIPFADLAHYFVLGSSSVTSAQGLFMHYRSTLSLFLVLPTIYAIAKYKKLNTPYTAIYLLLCSMFFQYFLHLPASYLTKKWFWTPPSGSENIREMIHSLPDNISIASQVNITPHITHRTHVYTIWPNTKTFIQDSPCSEMQCNWFKWAGNPEYLLVDTSPEWDARHLLTNNEEFKTGILNLESTKVISVENRIGSTTLYKILKNPSEIK